MIIRSCLYKVIMERKEKIHDQPTLLKRWDWMPFGDVLGSEQRRLRLKTELYVIRRMVQTRRSILYNEIDKMLKISS